MTRKATAVERPRCTHCRNPIKDHHVAVDPNDGDRTFHEDCWKASHPDAPSPDTLGPAAAEAELSAEQRSGHESSHEQRDYEERIASGGLAALLSPYVSGLPVQRNGAETISA